MSFEQIKRSSDIIEVLRNKQILIYGAGFVGNKFYSILKKNHLEKNIQCFVVSEKNVEQNRKVNGVAVKSVYDIRRDIGVKRSCDFIICIAVHESIRNEIEKLLNDLNLTHYIYIYPYIMELMLEGEVKEQKDISVKNIMLANRDDYRIAVRTLAIDNYFHKNNCGFDIYKSVMQLQCNEQTAEKRLNAFCNLLDNWQERGYDKKTPILVDETGVIIDGNHRFSIARYVNMKNIDCKMYQGKIDIVKLMGKGACPGEEAIRQAGLSDREMDLIIATQKHILEM